MALTVVNRCDVRRLITLIHPAVIQMESNSLSIVKGVAGHG